jgi:hypothetical protein
MHNIEPFYNWRDYYIADEDRLSPFYGRTYNEFEYSTTIYNYFIHPQWDEIGSPTLFIKILFVDYDSEFAIIELFGEWNDCIHNDIMFLKTHILDVLQKNNINKFILIGENVLNFHISDIEYYEEWFEETNDKSGWIVGLNFRPHVLAEMNSIHLNYYIMDGRPFQNVNWRSLEPLQLFKTVDNIIMKSLTFNE